MWKLGFFCAVVVIFCFFNWLFITLGFQSNSHMVSCRTKWTCSKNRCAYIVSHFRDMAPRGKKSARWARWKNEAAERRQVPVEEQIRDNSESCHQASRWVVIVKGPDLFLWIFYWFIPGAAASEDPIYVFGESHPRRHQILLEESAIETTDTNFWANFGRKGCLFTCTASR